MNAGDKQGSRLHTLRFPVTLDFSQPPAPRLLAPPSVRFLLLLFVGALALRWLNLWSLSGHDTLFLFPDSREYLKGTQDWLAEGGLERCTEVLAVGEVGIGVRFQHIDLAAFFHAEIHYRKGSDYDRRLALISFDNSIEVSIATYLSLREEIWSVLSLSAIF